jgi:hypothetical protein
MSGLPAISDIDPEAPKAHIPRALKWLELLKQIAPCVTRVAILFNPTTAPYANYYLEPFEAAAQSFAVEETVAPVWNSGELESVIAKRCKASVLPGGAQRVSIRILSEDQPSC